jgi:hypothetical protein
MQKKKYFSIFSTAMPQSDINFQPPNETKNIHQGMNFFKNEQKR